MIITNTLRLLRWGMLMSIFLVLFQNCGQGFKTLPATALNDAASAVAQTPYAPPLIEMISVPAAIYNKTASTITFRLKTDDRVSIASLTCKVDALSAQDCRSGILPLTNLAEGPHTVVLLGDDSKNQKTAETRISFVVDTKAPLITVSSVPSGTTLGTGLSVTFSATDETSGVDKVECSRDNSAYTLCTSPYALPTLANGSHTFSIRAVDRAANSSEVKSFNWVVNSSAPTVTITVKPAVFTNNTSASFTFSGTANGMALSKYECALDSTNYTACSSPAPYSSLQKGSHTFNVRGYSAANVVSSAVSVTWMIDIDIPTTPVITSNVGNVTNAKAASISFTSSDAGSLVKGYQCALDAAGFSDCVSPISLMNLAEGTHSYKVKSFDNAGNASAVGTYSWSIDSVVPEVNLTSVPLTSTTETSANFVFTALDSGSGIKSIECSIDGGAYASCTSPKLLTNLSVGAHSFTIKALDQANNQKIVMHSWSVIGATLSGAQLYANNCALCHLALASSTKINRTASDISSALGSIPNMSTIKLSSAEVAAIADALKVVTTPSSGDKDLDSVAPSSAVVASCPSGSLRGMAKRGLRRLTKKELTATIKDLQMPSSDAFDSIMDDYPELPEMAEVGKFDQRYSELQTSVWTRYVHSLAESYSKDAGKRSFGGDCFTKSSITEACWNDFFTNFGAKVWRHPMTSADVTALTNSVKSMSTENGVYQALHILFRAPDFLFHLESGVSDDGTRVRLSDYEVANRISYGIIGSMPDATLAAAAREGTLKTVAQVEAQVNRLIQTNRAKDKLKNFFAEWLELSRVSTPHYLIAEWTMGLGGVNEFEKYYKNEIFDYLFWVIWKEQGTFKDLMTRTIAFPRSYGKFNANPNDPATGKDFSPLAGIYGNDKTANFFKDGETPQAFPAPNNPGLVFRAGLLANQDLDTNPIRRGVFVKRRIFCDVLPDPDFSLVSARLAAVGTLDRFKMANHQITTAKTSDTTCVGCHSQINPVGFAMEGFDPVGKARSVQQVWHEDGKWYDDIKNGPPSFALPIPVTASLGGKSVSVSSAAQMAQEIANSKKAQLCMATFILHHYERRYENQNDGCALAEASASVDQNRPVLDLFVKMLANEDIFWRKQ